MKKQNLQANQSPKPRNRPQTCRRSAVSITAPVVTVLLLALRPLFGIVIDLLVALPLGGFAVMAAMGRWKQLGDSLGYGLGKMSSVAILLVGTGAIAGIIKASSLNADLIALLGEWHIGGMLIAPDRRGPYVRGNGLDDGRGHDRIVIVLRAVLDAGIPGVWGASMVNAGATVLDHLPHGSFFHATGGCTEVSITQRLRLVVYESMVGLTLTLCSIGCCKLWMLFG